MSIMLSHSPILVGGDMPRARVGPATARIDGGAFSPVDLFAGAQGFFIDFTDLSSLAQNSDGTGAAAADQPVGFAADRSGNAHNATQTTAANRPTLRLNATTGFHYAEFDGVNDGMLTDSINWGVDAITVFVAQRKISDAASGEVVSFSTDPAGAATGIIILAAPLTTSEYFFRLKGTSIGTVAVDNAAFAAPHSAVLTGHGDISTDNVTFRVNGAVAGTSVIDMGTGNLGNHVAYIGRRAGTSNPFNGHIYAMLAVGRVCTAGEIASMEAWLAARCGVVLP